MNNDLLFPCFSSSLLTSNSVYSVLLAVALDQQQINKHIEILTQIFTLMS
jgi:hypothetical protein